MWIRFSGAMLACLIWVGDSALFAQKANFAGSARVDASYQSWGYNWLGNNSGSYDARYKLFERNGALVLCGAGYLSGTVGRAENKSALRQAKLMLNGQQIMKDLSFFENVRRRNELDIGSATCFFTGAKGKLVTDAKIELVIPDRARR